MKLSDAQRAAVREACRIATRPHTGPNSNRVTVKGLAGTGKTTIAAAVDDELKDLGFRSTVCAPTNKACSVLRSKGFRNAQTIHGLSQRLEGVTKDDDGRKILHFADKDFDSSVLLVDEASMVDDRLDSNLERCCPRIICFGDHGQLPPVNGKSVAFERGTQIELTEIFRQADGNPIIDLAYAVRNGLDYDDFEAKNTASDDGVHWVDRNMSNVGNLWEHVGCFLASTNAARIGINNSVRQYLGHAGHAVVPGDMLMIKSNNKRLQLFNGEQAKVTDVIESVDTNAGVMTLVEIEHPLEGNAVKFWVIDEQLDKLDKDFDVDELPINEKTFDQLGVSCFENEWGDLIPSTPIMEANYGFCTTIHKSQGSQWPNIAIWTRGWDGGHQARQLRYTAVTRAAKNVILV